MMVFDSHSYSHLTDSYQQVLHARAGHPAERGRVGAAGGRLQVTTTTIRLAPTLIFARAILLTGTGWVR